LLDPDSGLGLISLSAQGTRWMGAKKVAKVKPNPEKAE
jgi:hypothetical protein